MSFRAATRTWKNSSRFELKIARNLTRSSNGIKGSSASASTRALNSSQESSRFRNRGWSPSTSPDGSPRCSRCVAIDAGYRRSVSPSGGGFLFGQPEIPVEDQVLALRVTGDALAVAPELRIVRRQEH